MNELKKDIESAYKLLSTIPVSGDAVDAAAACRAALRSAYKRANDFSGETCCDQTEGAAEGGEG